MERNKRIGFDLVEKAWNLYEQKDYAGALDALGRAVAIAKIGNYKDLLIAALRLRSDCNFDKGLTQQGIEDAQWADNECCIQNRAVRGAFVKEMKVMMRKGKYSDALTFLVGSIRADEGPSLKWKYGTEWMPEALCLLIECAYKVPLKDAQKMLRYIGIPREDDIWSRVLTILSKEGKWMEMCVVVLGAQTMDVPETDFDQIAGDMAASAANVDLSSLFNPTVVNLRDLKAWGTLLTKTLILMGASYTTVSKNPDLPPLFFVAHQCIRMEDKELLRFLLECHHFHLGERNRHGDTILHSIVSGTANHNAVILAEVIGVLVQFGADLTARDNKGFMPLELSQPNSHLQWYASTIYSAPVGEILSLLKKLKEEGNTEFRQRNCQEAVRHYKRALEVGHQGCMNPLVRHEMAIVNANLSTTFKSLQQYSRAVGHARACLNFDPTYSKGYFRLGQALVQMGKMEEAFNVYFEGARICPLDNDDGAQLIREMITILKMDTAGNIKGEQLENAKVVMLLHWERCLEMMTKEKQWEYVAMMMLGPDLHSNPSPSLRALWVDPERLVGEFGQVADLTTALAALEQEGWEDWLPQVLLKLLQAGANWRELGKKQSMKPLHALVKICAASKTTELLEHVLQEESNLAATAEGDRSSVFHTAIESVGNDVDHPGFLNLLCLMKRAGFRTTHKDTLGRQPQDMVPPNSTAFKVLSQASVTSWENLPASIGDQNWKKPRGVAADSVDSVPLELSSKAKSKGRDSSKSQQRQKEEEAERLREAGNKEYGLRNYQQAIQLYSQAIQVLGQNQGTRVEETHHLSILHANRSECYLRLSQPKLALEDAMTSVHLDGTWYKAHLRVGRAQMALNNHKMAMQAFTNCFNKLPQGRGQDHERLQIDVLCDLVIAYSANLTKRSLSKSEVPALNALKALVVPQYMWLRVSYQLYKKREIVAAGTAFFCHERKTYAMKDRFVVDLKEFCVPEVLKLNHWIQQLVIHCLESGSDVHTLAFCKDDKYLHAAVKLALYVYTSEHNQLLYWLFVHRVHPNHEENITDAMGNTALHTLALTPGIQDFKIYLMQFLITEGVDPTRANRFQQYFTDLIPMNELRFYKVASEELEAFRQQTNIVWINTLREQLLGGDYVPKKGPVHARQKKKQDQRTQPQTSAPMPKDKKTEPKRSKSAAKKETGGASGSTSGYGACEECWRVLGECRDLVEKDSYKALNKLSGILTRNHRNSHHDQVVQKGLELVTAEISRTLTPVVPKTILSLPEALYEQILQRLAKDEKWRQLDAAARQFYTERGEHMLKNFARNISVLSVLQSSSLCSAEQLRLDILELLMNSGAVLTQEDAVAGIPAALKNREYRVLEKLVLSGADPSAISLTPGDTPLHVALTIALEHDKGNFSLFDKLVELGQIQPEEHPYLSMVATDDEGNTLLHLACAAKMTKHSVKAVEKLLALQIPVNYVNNAGKTALQLLPPKDRREQYLRVSMHTAPQAPARIGTGASKKEGGKGAAALAERKQEKEDKRKNQEKDTQSFSSSMLSAKPGALAVAVRRRIEELIASRPEPNNPMLTSGSKKKMQAERRLKDRASLEEPPFMARAEGGYMDGSGDAKPKPALEKKKSKRREEWMEEEEAAAASREALEVDKMEDSEEDSEEEEEEEETAGAGVLEEEEIDLTAFDNLEWEVECTAEVWKSLGDKKVPYSNKQRVVRCIQQLARGEWRKRMVHPVEGAPTDLQLFKGRVGHNVWLLWELAIAFSPRLSQAAEQRMLAELSGGESSAAARGGRMYTELIRAWDVVMDHAHVGRSIDRIFKSHNRGQTCLIQRKLYGLKDSQPCMVGTKRLPRIFSETEVGVEQQSQLTLYPPASANQTEFHILKFYSFNAALVSNILRNIQTKVDFPFRVTDREHAIIHLQSNAPLLLLGRSGTGKTTCCLYRLWALFQSYWSKAKHSGPMLPRTQRFLSAREAAEAEEMQEEEEEAAGTLEVEDLEKTTAHSSPPPSHHHRQYQKQKQQQSKQQEEKGQEAKEEENGVAALLENLVRDEEETEEEEAEGEKEEVHFDHLHQVFVTKNVVLCTEVHKNFSELCQASEAAEQHAARLREREALPTRLQDADDFTFPLFVTSRQLLLMLDASLPGEPFFQRNPDGTLKHRITGWGNQVEIFTPIGIDHDSDDEGDEDNDDDSDDDAGLENVEEVRAAEAAAKKRGERQKREVTYNVFVNEVWSRFSKKERSHYHPSLVWMEIMSFIKGSFEALGTRTGYLSREGYQELGRKRAPNFSGERDRVYDLFERYRDMCHQMALFDEADLVFHIYQRLRLLDNQPWAIHQVFVDETQDFTQAELCVLLRLSQNPNDMFLTGDTAQSIMRGISFRFADLQSLFFYARRSMQALGKTAAIGVPKKVYQLTHNYRSHAGILSLASSVLDLLHNFFPESFDQLQPDQGLFPGPLPVLLQSGSPGDLALLLRGNQRKTSHIEFGAHQAILVVSEEAREKLPEELSMGLVLTIYEAKGLEFDDILLYNFFTDSEAGKEWRVVTKFLEDLRVENTENQEDLVELDESVLDQSGRPRPLNFDPYQHKVLNSELKHLYTAITRARVNVWIFDQDQEKRGPMFEYFRARRLVRDVAVAEEETRLEETMFAEKSSATEWVKRGDEIMRRGLYDVAAKCYRLGGDERKEAIAVCYKKALQASRCRDNPRQMREEFLIAGQHFLEVNLDKKAAVCLVNAKEPRLAALVFEKCGMMEQAARHYVRMRSMEDASRCYEYIGWYDQAVEVLQRDELYEKAIDCLRRYEQVKKDMEQTRGRIPPELLEHAPKPEYNIERLSYNLATRHHRNGKTDKMVEALERLPSVADRINFLRDKKYIQEAADLMAKNGQGTEAARLMLGEGHVDEALKLAMTAGGDKQVRAECHLALVRSMFRNHMDLDTMKLHLHQALLLCQELGNDAGKAEAQLLQSRVEINPRLAMTAAANFQRCRPSPNVAGELEALDIFIHSSSATDSLDDADMVIEGINKTFELIKLLLGNRSSAERLSYYLYLGFFGLNEVKDSEGTSLLALRRAENPLFLELVPRKYWIFQKSDWKKPIIHLKVQDACLALSERLLTRIASEWMGFLSSFVSHHYQGLLQCMFYRKGSDCPMQEEDTCPLLHEPLTSEKCRKLFRLCLMQVRLRHILDKGLVQVKRLQLPPPRCNTLLKLIEECQKENMGEEAPGVPECFWPCHSLLLLLMPDDHLHRQLFEGSVKQRIELFQNLQSTLIREPMERYFQHLWNTGDEATTKKDNLLKYRVKRTDWLVKLCLLGPLFRMKLNARNLSEQLVMDIMNTNPSWLKRGNRYALLMGGGGQGATQTLATRFIEAYKHLEMGEPLESLIRFTKFVRILSDRNHSSLFPDHNIMLLLLEFYTALGLLLVAKTSQAKVTIPASYLNAVTLVEMTTAHEGKPGISVQKTIEDLSKRKGINAGFVRQRMEMIVGVLCGYNTRFSLIRCLFLLDGSQPEACMLKERAIVLVLTILSNIPLLTEASCEIPLMQTIHRTRFGPSCPQRLAGTLAKVWDANGIYDVASALLDLLIQRDDEFLFQLQWSKWDPRRRSMVSLSKKLDGNLYPGHFMIFNKEIHTVADALLPPLEAADTTAEEQLTEEEARKLEEDYRAWEQKQKMKKAGRTILRILRHNLLLKRARQARQYVAKRLQMEVFVPFTVTDSYCGLCGVQLRKAVEGGPMEDEGEEGQEEGREQEEEAELEEARVTKEEHLRTEEHIVKNADFGMFRRDYEQTIAPNLTKMGSFIIKYRLRDERTRDTLYKEMAMDITGLVALYDKVTQQVQEIMLSRGWNLRQDVQRSLHELNTRMSVTLQQFITHKHDQVQREEKRRQQQDQAEGDDLEVEPIQEELEEEAAEEPQFEEPIPQARGGGKRRGGLRRQKRKNRR